MSGSLKRIIAVTRVRNLEFLRDRSSLGWNIVLPIVLLLGLSLIFSGEGKPLYKVGVHAPEQALTADLHPFLATQYISFFSVEELAPAIEKVSRHQIDMLLDVTVVPPRYWVNTTSPKGYTLERMLGGEPSTEGPAGFARQAVDGEEVRYVDWLVPGILGMNMMFSCLFGVGYVIVRYRKNGYLKRLNATPLTALEFIIAQVLSRLLLIMIITVAIFAAVVWLLDLRVEGSYGLLFVLALLGSTSMIAMGLTVSSRVTSEELAGGLLNVLSWPMMFLSGVWFSLEGAPTWVQAAADLLPLTHMLNGVRAVMLDGAGVGALGYELTVLTVMTVAFLLLGAVTFKWIRE